VYRCTLRLLYGLYYLAMTIRIATSLEGYETTIGDRVTTRLFNNVGFLGFQNLPFASLRVRKVELKSVNIGISTDLVLLSFSCQLQFPTDYPRWLTLTGLKLSDPVNAISVWNSDYERQYTTSIIFSSFFATSI
jgi:hypothetical protein